MNVVESWRDLLKGKKGRDIMVMIMHNEHNVYFLLYSQTDLDQVICSAKTRCYLEGVQKSVISVSIQL